MKAYNTIFDSEDKFRDFVIKHKINKAKTVLVVCYSSLNNLTKNEEILRSISTLLPNAILSGATTAGEIFEDTIVIESFVVSLMIFDSTKVEFISYHGEKDQIHIGKKIAEYGNSIRAKAVIIFGDGLQNNGDLLLNGINHVGVEFVVAGGFAANSSLMMRASVFFGTNIYSNTVTAVFLSGMELDVSTCKSFNWMPIGPVFKITHAEGNRVFSINGMSPYELYKRYLGENIANNLPLRGVEFPFVFFRDGNFLGRAPIALHDDGSMSFGGSVYNGEVVQFGFGDIDSVLSDSSKLPDQLRLFAPQAIMVFSCMARKAFLGDFISIETKDMAKIAPTAGFFTFGEFFYDPKAKNALFFNESITVLSLKESSATEQKKSATLKHALSKTTAREVIYPFSETFSALLRLNQQTSLELNELNRQLSIKNEEAYRKNAESESMLIVQSRSAVIGEMLSMIAHQWRQPLSIISMINNNMRLKYMAPEKFSLNDIFADMDVVDKNLEYLSQTIEDFRSFFKPETLLVETTPSQMFDKLKTLIDPILNSKHIKLQIIINYDIKMSIYANRLIQALLSVVTNSVDAIIANKIKKGVITVEAKISNKNKKRYKIIIRDNGGGIQDNILSSIFEPYVTTKSLNGTGIGLYMSKTIVENHFNGTIFAGNTGNGAEFIIEFPLP